MSILGWITKPISNAIVRNVMAGTLEKIMPLVKYLAERAILIPAMAIGAIVAGYKFDYLTGDGGMYGIVGIAVAVAISRIFNTKGSN